MLEVGVWRESDRGIGTESPRESERGDGDRDTETQRNSKKQMTDTQERRIREELEIHKDTEQVVDRHPEKNRETEDTRKGKRIC